MPEPPEWLSADGIDRYERDMLSVRDAQRGSAPVSWNDRLMVLDTVRDANGRETALLFNPGNHHTPFVVADGYDPATHHWSSGSYRNDLISAVCELHDLPDPRDAVDSLRAEANLGIDLDAEIADMREVSGGTGAREASRDAGER